MASFKIRVLGEDPSMRNWGIAVADIVVDVDNMSYAVQVLDLILVETESSKDVKKTVRRNSDDLDRAQLIHEKRNEAYDKYKPDISFVEVPVGSQSARAMCSYGICVGVLGAREEPIIQMKPDEVKLAGAGDKYATKEEMIHWATITHPDAPWMVRAGKFIAKNEHLADALAAIYAGLKSDQFKIYAMACKSSWRARQPDFKL